MSINFFTKCKIYKLIIENFSQKNLIKLNFVIYVIKNKKYYIYTLLVAQAPIH